MPTTLPTDLSVECRLALRAEHGVALESGAYVLTWTDTLSGNSGVYTRATNGTFFLSPIYFASPRVCLGSAFETVPTTVRGRMRMDRSSGGVTVDPSQTTLAAIVAFNSLAVGNSSGASVAPFYQHVVSLESDRFCLVIRSDGRIGVLVAGTYYFSDLRAGSSFECISATASGSVVTIRRGRDREEIIAPVPSTASHIATIGQQNAAFILSFCGHVMDVLVYEGEMTDADETLLEEYADYRIGRTAAPTYNCIWKGSSTSVGTDSTGDIRGYIPRVEASFPTVFFQNFSGGPTDFNGLPQTTDTFITDKDMMILALQDVSFTRSFAILQPGSNDLYYEFDGATTALAELRSLCAQLKAADPDLLIAVMTVTPRDVNGSPPVGYDADAQRLIYNQAIRDEVGEGDWDVVIDVGARPGNSVEGDQDGALYSDGTHFNDDGFAANTQLVVEGIEALIALAADEADDPEYLTTSARVLSQLGLAAWPTGDEAFVEQTIADVSTQIARHCNRINTSQAHTFLTEARTETYNGTGSNELVLTNVPITSIASVYVISEDGTESLVDSDDYRVDPTSGVLRLLSGSDSDWMEWEPYTASNRPSYFFGPAVAWPKGHRNIRVTYTGGYATVPSDLAMVATDIVCNRYLNRRRNYDASSESVGGRSVTLRGVEDLIRAHNERLSPYVRAMV